MSASTALFWSVFLLLLPLAYGLFRILFDWLLDKLLPPHKIIVEVFSADGSSVSTSVDVTNDKEFYRLAMSAIREGSALNGKK
ncbi:hypothetical protein ACE1B4_01440 [Aeromonas veronii]|uniref:hypothetical protein n=1 Tax=Aeromonas veronii TaxID=654 RepID=UPI001396AFDF|nr:hypothetical protein [Aeromonas veronii]TNI03172.1 hypothetical protein CF135_18705 [Aeromonas veronii]HDO1314045.1 hypothetical protein [Aeromonas veronii]